MPDRDATLKYLEEVLDKDPFVDGPAIIAARNALLGVAQPETPAAQSYEDTQTEREELRAALSALRDELPDLDEATALGRIEAVDASAHPDLAAWQDRLRRFAETAEFREEAEDDSRVTAKVLESLTKVATAPEEMATTLRTQQLAKLSGSLAIQTARRIRGHYPELYDLEADWFERILSQKRDKKLASSPAVIGTTFIVIWIVFRVLRVLFRD